MRGDGLWHMAYNYTVLQRLLKIRPTRYSVYTLQVTELKYSFQPAYRYIVNWLLWRRQLPIDLRINYRELILNMQIMMDGWPMDAAAAARIHAGHVI